MTIINGQIANADEVMNAMGKIFLNYSQSLFNEAYIGFDSKLYNSGAPNLKNVLYSVFAADDADVNYGFFYDSTNDIYRAPDLSTGLTEYIIIEATSLSAPWDSNDCKTMQISSGKWLVYCDTGTDAVRRAQIHKSLWYGTNGTDQLISDFTSITAVKTSDANDVDKKAYFATTSPDVPAGTTTAYYQNIAITFNDTTNNTDFSSWSNLAGGGGSSYNNNGQEVTSSWQVPTATTLNSVTGVGSGDTKNEIGTDMSADELDNPATATLRIISGKDAQGDTATGVGTMIMLYAGTITTTLTQTGTPVTTEINFNVDNSIPAMTAADTLINEGAAISTLIFKDTVVSTTNAIPSINSTIDATSSEQISISADGGSNYTDVDNGEIARLTAGTALWRRIVITRTDLSKTDNVSEQAVQYNLY